MAFVRQISRCFNSWSSTMVSSNLSSCHPAQKLSVITRSFGVITSPANKNSLLYKVNGLSAMKSRDNNPVITSLPLLNQVRNYKAKVALRLRCSGCYFVTRNERLYVECKLKPRHKQMMKISKHKLYKEDYSKGNIKRALHWNFHHDRYYQMGNTKFAKHNWLEGKLGHTI